jgi:hypothetical protein
MLFLTNKIFPGLLFCLILQACGGNDSPSLSSDYGVEKVNQGANNVVKNLTEQASEKISSTEIIVEWKDGVARPSSSQLADLNLEAVSKNFSSERISVLRTTKSMDARLMIDSLSKSPWFETVFPSKQLELVADETRPGKSNRTLIANGAISDSIKMAAPSPLDPFYSSQIYLTNTSVPTTHIRAEAAWDLHTGTGNEVVAIVGTGVYVNHPDLAGNIWVNSNDSSVNSVDDDGNGYVDDINGANTVLNNGSVAPLFSFNDNTGLAGIIGARAGNGISIAGINWAVKIMPVKVDSNGSYFESNLIKGLNYVKAQKQNGVNVRTILLTLDVSSSAVSAAVESLKLDGILVIGAYPSTTTRENYLSVAGSTGNASYDLMAPSGSLTTIAGSTGTFNVSSASNPAAIATGVAALLWSYQPTLTYAQVKQRLIESTAAPAFAAGQSRSGGFLDARAALDGTCNLRAPIIIDPSVEEFSNGVPYYPNGELSYVVGMKYLARVAVTSKCGNNALQPTLLIGGVGSSLRDEGVYPDSIASDGVYVGYFTFSSAGTKTISALLSDGSTTYPTNQKSVLVVDPIAYSINAEPYTWEDAISGGTRLALSSASSITLSTPFPIRVYGADLSTIRVSVFGEVCNVGGNCNIGAGPIPSRSSSNRLQTNLGRIAVWSNTDFQYGNASATEGVFVNTIGVTPNRKFVVSWENIRNFWSSANSVDGVSFQIVFAEGSSDFVTNYKDTTTDNTSFKPDGGLRGAAGIQYLNGRIGTQLFNNTIFLTDQTSYRYSAFSFNDVNPTASFRPSILAMKNAMITNGCNNGVDYCPFNNVTRAEMAAFLSRSINGNDALFSYSGVPNANFSDVSTSSAFFKYINYIKSKGITSGCGGNNYCPSNAVTRAEMAKFIVLSVRGGNYTPPPAIGQFNDVNNNSTFAPFIEELSRMGVTNGCGSGQYCPTRPVTRWEMASFLQRAFRYYDYNNY